MTKTWDDGIPLDSHTSYTSIPNYFFDYVLPLLPQDDADVLLYAWRRTQGYQDTAGNRTPQAIPYEQFTNGRCNEETGRPIDFGTGVSKGRVSEAITRLRAAKFLTEHKKGRAGRPSSKAPAESQGSVWGVNLRAGEHNFAPIWAAMTYGQLGRYVKAARFGILPPPRGPRETKALEEAVRNRRAQSHNQPEIDIPEEWREIVPIRNNYEIVPIRNDKPGKLFPYGTNTGDNCSRVEQFRDDLPQQNAENEDPKETLTLKETFSKEKGGASPPAAPAPGTSRSRKIASAATPSFDGQDPQAWVAGLIDHCYDGAGLPTWEQHLKSVQFLRTRYPLEVVLDYHDERRREARSPRTLTPRILAEDIVQWPGLERAMQLWHRRRAGPVLAPPGPVPEAGASLAEAEAILAEHGARQNERALLLAELGTDEQAQAWWLQTCLRDPELRGALWREAVLILPQAGEAIAALAFDGLAQAERAQSSGARQVAGLRIGNYGPWQGGVKLIITTVPELRRRIAEDRGGGEGLAAAG